MQPEFRKVWRGRPNEVLHERLSQRQRSAVHNSLWFHSSRFVYWPTAGKVSWR